MTCGPGKVIWIIFLVDCTAYRGTCHSSSDFQDALSQFYGLMPLNTASTCHCGISFSVDHAMVCSYGGFPIIHHNEVCDLTATLLTEVCHNVATKPSLQPISACRDLSYNGIGQICMLKSNLRY